MAKMDRTFALRQEVISNAPMISNVQERWPALFDAVEDMTEATALSETEKTTVGIYVTRETPGNDFSDVGIIVEGEVMLQDLDNVAIATAMLFGLFYSLNMRYPPQLCYTFEVIQKVVMELDVTQLSRKTQSLKIKLLQ